jgi:hypothetical protein
MIRSFDIEHEGETYHVELEITDCELHDDSFDHEFGTEERHHWEVTDYLVVAVEGPDGETDEEAVPGLGTKIALKAQELDVEEWER